MVASIITSSDFSLYATPCTLTGTHQPTNHQLESWQRVWGSAVGSLDTNSRENSRITLGLLEAVESGRAHTQRGLAADLGIALGLVNIYLKRCVKKGLVKVSQAPARRFAYYLTPNGFAEKSRLTGEYLSWSLTFFRMAS